MRGDLRLSFVLLTWPVPPAVYNRRVVANVCYRRSVAPVVTPVVKILNGLSPKLRDTCL
jgi:hypothetical protein